LTIKYCYDILTKGARWGGGKMKEHVFSAVYSGKRNEGKNQ
jgi:hypothetical protein